MPKFVELEMPEVDRRCSGQQLLHATAVIEKLLFAQFPSASEARSSRGYQVQLMRDSRLDPRSLQLVEEEDEDR